MTPMTRSCFSAFVAPTTATTTITCWDGQCQQTTCSNALLQRQRQRWNGCLKTATSLQSSSSSSIDVIVGEYISQIQTPLPPFLPKKQVQDAVGVATVTLILLLVLVRLPVFFMLQQAASKDGIRNNDNKKATKARAFRQARSVIYVVINALFTLFGTICLVRLIRGGVWGGRSGNNGGDPLSFLTQRAQGNVPLGLFGSTQAGYSLWSILVDPKDAQPGRKLNDERTVMFFHHVLTVLVGMLLATGQLGFRVYGPFFYGVSEISSVPLSLMKVLAKGHRRGYDACKVAFVLCFLLVRVIAWMVFATYLFSDMLKVMVLRSELGKAVLVPLAATVPLWAITYMQFHWSVMIVKQLTNR